MYCFSNNLLYSSTNTSFNELIFFISLVGLSKFIIFNNNSKLHLFVLFKYSSSIIPGKFIFQFPVKYIFFVIQLPKSSTS